MEQIAHQTNVGDLEDRRVAVFVDGHDSAGIFDAGQVLDGTGDAHRHIAVSYTHLDVYKRQLLDVGCAHGWFIERASSRFDVTGIEPDAGVAAATRARGLPVRSGFFPDVLGPDECFDVIVFNDVLEHIPDINTTLVACWQHLAPGGCVIVNAPSSRGLLYRLSVLLARTGLGRAFDRMWQLGFPSPHVHYFATTNLVLLAHKAGFEMSLIHI